MFKFLASFNIFGIWLGYLLVLLVGGLKWWKFSTFSMIFIAAIWYYCKKRSTVAFSTISLSILGKVQAPTKTTSPFYVWDQSFKIMVLMKVKVYELHTQLAHIPLELCYFLTSQVCMYVCVYVCMYLCNMYVCVYIYMYVYGTTHRIPLRSPPHVANTPLFWEFTPFNISTFKEGSSLSC